jgi:hypothetical protein
MKSVGTLLRIAAALCFGAWTGSGVVACSDTDSTENAAEEEGWEIVPSRVAPCRTHCEAVLDPACPHPHFVDMGLTMDECLKLCPSTNPNWSGTWGSGDRCAAENIARQDCYAALTCEERISTWDNSAPDPCAQEKELLGECVRSE